MKHVLLAYIKVKNQSEELMLVHKTKTHLHVLLHHVVDKVHLNSLMNALSHVLKVNQKSTCQKLHVKR